MEGHIVHPSLEFASLRMLTGVEDVKGRRFWPPLEVLFYVPCKRHQHLGFNIMIIMAGSLVAKQSNT